MGKTNYIILFMGLGTCIFLSLMMQRAIGFKIDQDIPPVIGAITESFGSRLDKASDYMVHEQRGVKVAELALYPVLGTKPVHLVRTIGEFTWQESGEDDGFDVLVVTVDEGFGHPRRFQVAKPFTILNPVRELKPGQEPRLKSVVLPKAGGKKPAAKPVPVPSTQPAKAGKKTPSEAPKAAESELLPTPPKIPPKTPR